MSHAQKPTIQISIEQVDYQPSFDEPKDDDLCRYQAIITHPILGEFTIHDVRSHDIIYKAGEILVFRGHAFTKLRMAATAEFPTTLTAGEYHFFFDQSGAVTAKCGDQMVQFITQTAWQLCPIEFD